MIKYYESNYSNDKISIIILIQDEKYNFNSFIDILYRIKSLKIISVKLDVPTPELINSINSSFYFKEIPEFIFVFDPKFKKILKNAADYQEKKYNKKTILHKMFEKYKLLEE